MESTFAKLWERAGDQADQIARVVETTQKLDTFFVDKYLCKKDDEYDVASPQPEGTSSAKPAISNDIARPEDIQGIYDRALQQLRAEIRTELRDPGVNLTYQTPFSDYVEAAGSALTWYTKLIPGSIPDWATMELMFRMTIRFGAKAKAQHHDGQFVSMADLMNKVGSYQIVLNDMDERQNTSSSTYTPRTLKPRYGPNRHRIVGAIYSHVDPYYHALVAHRYSMDYGDKEEVAALELVSKEPARSQSLRQKLIKHDFGQLLTPEQLKGKKYYKYHNMWNHNTADCVKLKDQIQVWINEGVVTLDEEKIVSLVDENPFLTVAMVDVVPTLRNKAKSKYKVYTYKADLAHVLLDELIQANLLNIPWGTYLSEEQLASKTYCKFHNAWSHDTSECVQLKDRGLHERTPRSELSRSNGGCCMEEEV
ncbi:hypothetical protein ACLB2K_038510 [Fragaria x ananassa]